MIDDTELLELFSRPGCTRASGNEQVDSARVKNADFAEHESVMRIRELRRRWAMLRWRP